MSNHEQNLGRIIKQQRVMSGLTLREVSDKSGVSLSHLGRIERGERFPSAHILRKIVQPLGFQKGALLIHAGYLFPSLCQRGEQPLTGYFGRVGSLRGRGLVTRASRAATHGGRNSHYLEECRPKMTS